MVQYKPQNDTHKKWLYIINTVSKLIKQNKDKKVRGHEVLANSYFRTAYPVFEVMAERKILLQLHYSKKDKYLQQTVHKQDSLVKFLKKITKGKDFILEGLLFEEGQEKSIYDEMEQEIDITPILKEIEEEKARKKAEDITKSKKVAEAKEKREKEEFIKIQHSVSGGAKVLIDPFGVGFLDPDGMVYLSN